MTSVLDVPQQQPWTLATLEARWPDIPWREPIAVTHLITGAEHFACRVCIARNGLRGSELFRLPTDPAAVRQHIREHLA